METPNSDKIRYFDAVQILGTAQDSRFEETKNLEEAQLCFGMPSVSPSNLPELKVILILSEKLFYVPGFNYCIVRTEETVFTVYYRVFTFNMTWPIQGSIRQWVWNHLYWCLTDHWKGRDWKSVRDHEDKIHVTDRTGFGIKSHDFRKNQIYKAKA